MISQGTSVNGPWGNALGSKKTSKEAAVAGRPLKVGVLEQRLVSGTIVSYPETVGNYFFI